MFFFERGHYIALDNCDSCSAVDFSSYLVGYSFVELCSFKCVCLTFQEEDSGCVVVE